MLVLATLLAKTARVQGSVLSFVVKQGIDVMPKLSVDILLLWNPSFLATLVILVRTAEITHVRTLRLTTVEDVATSA